MKRTWLLLFSFCFLFFASKAWGADTAVALISTCPSAAEVQAFNADIDIRVDLDPTTGTLVCRAANGSADLTRLQERTYQALRLMQQTPFTQPLPWTNKNLYTWFKSTVRGIRFYPTPASFCCAPSDYIVIGPSNLAALTNLTADWVASLMVLFVHEARHHEWGGHTCGNNDQTIGELGAWGVQYYLDEWLATKTGNFFIPYQGGLSFNARDIAATRFCAPETGLFSGATKPSFGVPPAGGVNQTVAVTWFGTGTKQIRNVAIAGPNANEFQIVNNYCSASSTSPNCGIEIGFRPTAAGKRTAQLTLNEGTSNTDLSVPLVGGCTYTLTPPNRLFSPAGGPGTIHIDTQTGCDWSITPNSVQFTSAVSGAGPADVTYQMPVRSGGTSTLYAPQIAGIRYIIEQETSNLTLPNVGSLSQVTSQGTWNFTLNAVNLGASAATARFTFTDNNGAPLPLPLTFPLLRPYDTVGATLDRTMDPNSQVILYSTGPDSVPAGVGWGQFAATGNINGFGIFSNPLLGWNAVVPIETRNASKYYLAFDNTGALATGVAVANVATSAANINVIFRDDSGTQIGTATINLAAQGHDSFMLNAKYPITANKRGTVEFQTPQGGRISVLGLRANGPALTTLPVLASSDTAGGAIAHTTYNGGFTSTFFLVNTGTASAQFTLSFFDEAGNPLSVPLNLPQTGSRPVGTSLTQTLAPGAMLVVETVANDSAAPVVGSAQLSTTGNVSGFEIFKWTTFGQEASVPMETRTPGSFVLVFDNTNKLTTGVALSNVATNAATITVRIYDDLGLLLQTATLDLPGRGHTSFLLPSSFPISGNRNGMVEFVVPQGGKINAVGLRAKADGTLTTIPLLVR